MPARPARHVTPRIALPATALIATALVSAGLAAGLPGGAPPAAADNDALGYPVFRGTADPVPSEPAGFTVDGTMRAMYEADLATGDGTDFWMDRLLARHGADPSGDWLWSRGRAAFLKVHDPATVGFGGQLAYWESIDNRDGYTIRVGDGGFAEDVERRLQTPSHWRGEYADDSGLTLTVTKFITHNNVAVTNLEIGNTGTSDRSVPIRAESPYATVRDANELTGTVAARNNLTTISPRFSGDGMTVDGGALTRTVTVPAGESVTTKVQLGLLTDEIPASATEYQDYRTARPAGAFATHVRTYNEWWAENLPYIDIPDENIKKTLYYRWWLLRFNFLDADIPGNDYQFPTSMEGVLGYNNAIVLTIGMFIDDLKYLRDPVYSYGPWVSAGEVSKNARYVDNPGDPENWSNSYTQYLSESAWQAYQVHGGPEPIVQNLARYAEKDTYGQLDFYDQDGNGLIEYDWGALTGNDADAVSFDWREGRLDRAESAYVYSNALAAAEAFDLLGDTEKAAEMRAVAERVKDAVLTYLWNEESKLIEHRHVATDALVPWKEINNYYPFSVGLMPNEDEYKQALRLWTDASEYPIFPFYTANQADKAEAAEQGHPGSNNFSVINSTVTFRLLSSVLRNYPSEYITSEYYKKLLYWNAWAHYVDGDNRWPDQNEFWADWNPETQHIDYRSWIHHTQLGATNWTVIEDVIGLRPRSDTRLELSPIDIGWDHFTANDLRFRGSDLTIVWDAPGDGAQYYEGVPEGYSAYIDGERAFTADRLVHLVYDSETGEVDLPDESAAVDLGSAPPIAAAEDVRFENERIVDMFQKAGRDLRPDGTGENLAADAAPSASHTEEGTRLAGAIDGFTINEPYWGSANSGNDSDWYALDLGEPTTVSEIKLYFYNDRRRDGYAEPAMYTVQYLEDGQWVEAAGQSKSPAFPRANYNVVRFEPVTARQIRVLFTHQPGYGTGLKELQVFDTGGPVRHPVNAAPSVRATPDTSVNLPGQVRLTGVVKDDGLPFAQLETRWELVSGPGTSIFADPTSPTTIARFGAGGDYTLRLTASDGRRTSEAEVRLSVPPRGRVVNVAPFAQPAASYTSSWEDVTAINDGIDPPRSNDADNPRWGTWPEQGTQWAELGWEAPVRADSAGVYFFDDGGGVRVPASWKLQYWNGSAFADVSEPSAYETATDRYNKVTFQPVTTTRMRVVLESGNGSVGLLEWQVDAVRPARINPVEVSTPAGELPGLPAKVTLVYADGETVRSPVSWEAVTPKQVRKPGTSFNVVGLLDSTSMSASATVHVQSY